MLVIVLKVISMDQMILDILQTSKHKHKFPPRDSIVQIKSKLAMTGNSRSGAAIKQITEAYSSSAESVLEEFTENVLRNLSSLGLNSQHRILEIVSEASTNVIVEARGCALSEFPDENFKQLALNHFTEKSSPILEHLQRKVRLKDLDLGGTMSSVQITGSQIGNLVLGSVTQSELTATVTEIAKQGGTEAEHREGTSKHGRSSRKNGCQQQSGAGRTFRSSKGPVPTNQIAETRTKPEYD